MENRVVITGLGVIAPNAKNTSDFNHSLVNGLSGIRYYPELALDKFKGQAGGIPPLTQEEKDAFIEKYSLVKLRGTGILYGCMAGIEAWLDAGLVLTPADCEEPDWESGCIFGSLANGIESTHFSIKLIDQGNVRKIGGRAAQQAMNSGVSAYLGGLIGMGNQVTTNSSSGNTGCESILEGYQRIKLGLAERMLVGSSESSSKYVWALYDYTDDQETIFHKAAGNQGITAFTNQNLPEKASSPLSSNASGIVLGSGAGALVLESLRSAQQRKARIYAEILGGEMNAGGGLKGASTFISNKDAMVQCLKKAFESCSVKPEEIDLISGYLESTREDVKEIQAWSEVLKRKVPDFPWVNSVKSMIGHCQGASGAIEMVAAVLQVHHQYIHPSINSRPLHEQIADLLPLSKVPQHAIHKVPLKIVAKFSKGLGDVNSCILIKKWIE